MRVGIVMDIKQSNAVVMQTGGKFLSIPASKAWNIGDIVAITAQIKRDALNKNGGKNKWNI